MQGQSQVKRNRRIRGDLTRRGYWGEITSALLQAVDKLLIIPCMLLTIDFCFTSRHLHAASIPLHDGDRTRIPAYIRIEYNQVTSYTRNWTAAVFCSTHDLRRSVTQSTCSAPSPLICSLPDWPVIKQMRRSDHYYTSHNYGRGVI